MTATETPAASTLTLVERLDLPAAAISRGAILRAFDTLRRRLALSATGSEGAAAGFVELDLDTIPEESTGTVVVRATELEHGDHWQRVRYEAAITTDTDEHRIGHAIGQTVALSA